MTSYVTQGDAFHYGSSFQEKKEILKSKGLGNFRKISKSHNTNHDDNVKELTQRLKELQRTDSVISGQSSRTKDSGFNTLAVTYDILKHFSLRQSLSLGAIPIEDEAKNSHPITHECCQLPQPSSSSHHSKQVSNEPPSTNKKKARRLDDKKQATIRQHYYPEGGWGYVVLIVGTLVQMLSHGLQLSFGFFLLFLVEKWRRKTDLALWKVGGGAPMDSASLWGTFLRLPGAWGPDHTAKTMQMCLETHLLNGGYRERPEKNRDVYITELRTYIEKAWCAMLVDNVTCL
ncbi:unnamed protein product [Lepeophtheirus salmonis]|uniref:(salmon louse) hypothetical protein n=1 Tax=Lepeophtheirus salmonis TaxID=72036 RepID=A0A7R8H5L4_LEPSM|nr:unnamed protein product [Lepeophtheirus salmonis]CAF2869727.1 unnamed protein product [Lepeophtheirus salmonis]